MSHVVQVRAIERDGRTGPYRRAGFIWSPGWQEQVVNDAELDEISKDHFLELRVLDERTQASRRMQFAIAAGTEAKSAEASASQLRSKADALLAEAQIGLDALEPEPPPAPAPETNAESAFLAAMPDAVRPKSSKKR